MYLILTSSFVDSIGVFLPLKIFPNKS